MIRFCRALGYEGYQEFNLRLAQDLVEPVEYIHENISFDDSIEDLTQKIFQTNLKAVADTVLSVAVAVALGDSCLEFIRKSSEAVKSKRY